MLYKPSNIAHSGSQAAFDRPCRQLLEHAKKRRTFQKSLRSLAHLLALQTANIVGTLDCGCTTLSRDGNSCRHTHAVSLFSAADKKRFYVHLQEQEYLPTIECS